VERRRAIATQVSHGTPLSVLRGSQLAQTLPLWLLGTSQPSPLGTLTGGRQRYPGRVVGLIGEPGLSCLFAGTGEHGPHLP